MWRVSSCFFWKSTNAPQGAVKGWIRPASSNSYSCFLNSTNSSGVIQQGTCAGGLAPDNNSIRWSISCRGRSILGSFGGIVSDLWATYFESKCCGCCAASDTLHCLKWHVLCCVGCNMSRYCMQSLMPFQMLFHLIHLGCTHCTCYIILRLVSLLRSSWVHASPWGLWCKFVWEKVLTKPPPPEDDLLICLIQLWLGTSIPCLYPIGISCKAFHVLRLPYLTVANKRV